MYRVYRPLYLYGSLEGTEPCPGTGGTVGAGEGCPQKSGRVSCSPGAIQNPEASSAVPAFYTHTSCVNTVVLYI